MAKVTITQVRSGIGQSARHNGTLRALGLGKIGKSVQRDLDDPVVKGAVRKVRHLVRIQD